MIYTILLTPKFGKGIFQNIKALEKAQFWFVFWCYLDPNQCFYKMDPDPGKDIEVDPDPEKGSKWIRIRPNVVDPKP